VFGTKITSYNKTAWLPYCELLLDFLYFVSDVSDPAVAATCERLLDLASGLDFIDERINKTGKPYLHLPVNRTSR